MLEYHCDGCGKVMQKGELRYTVAVDIRAAYDAIEVSLHELMKDHRQELEDLIRQLSEQEANELEESVYKKIELHLCPTCQRAYVKDPLRFHPEQGASTPVSAGLNVDGFLRSLGYPKAEDSEQEESGSDGPE